MGPSTCKKYSGSHRKGSGTTEGEERKEEAEARQRINSTELLGGGLGASVYKSDASG